MSRSAFPPLHSLRAFEAVGRHLSFKMAAEELAVTPAAISHLVKALEEFLDVRLLERRNRAVRLTEAGRQLHPGLADGFGRLREAVGRLQAADNDRILTVSCGPAFAAKWLVPRMHSFIDKHPKFDARISANIAFANFASDGIDIALRYGKGEWPGVHLEHLMQEYVLPLASPNFVIKHKIKRPNDLRRCPLIHDDSLLFAKNSPTWNDWLKLADVTQCDAARGLRFNHADHGLEAAAEGVGIVLGRWNLAENDLRHGRLIAPFPLAIDTGMAFYLVCPKGAELKPKVKIFRHWLQSEIAVLTKPENLRAPPIQP